MSPLPYNSRSMFSDDPLVTLGEIAAVLWITVVFLVLIGIFIFAICFLLIHNLRTKTSAAATTPSVATVSTDCDEKDKFPHLMSLLRDLADNECEDQGNNVDLEGYEPLATEDAQTV